MTATTAKRKPVRTVHTYLAEQAAAQKARAERGTPSGEYVGVGEMCSCVNGAKCLSPAQTIMPGAECYMHRDGSVECLLCRPKGRPVVVEVVDRECVVCGSRFQFLGDDDEDSTGLTCQRKCRRTLDRRNAKSADAADVD